MQAYFDFEHFGWPFRERLYEMPAAFVDEFRTVHVIVLSTRNEVAEERGRVEAMSPSQKRLWAARKQMEAEPGIPARR